MIDLTREQVQRAIDREPAAVSRLVSALMPLVQVRVARSLNKRRYPGRDPRQEVEDFCQEVFLALFADGGRALRAWDPALGMSLANFVGMLAEHQVATIFRSGRRRPWTDDPFTETEMEAVESSDVGPEPIVASRELFDRVLERLKENLSPKGYMIFIALIVEERDVKQVGEEMGMTSDALYAWKSRLSKQVRQIAQELEKVTGASEIAASGCITGNQG